MDENVLRKDYFKKNPLKELSAAVIADFSANTAMFDSLNDKISDIVGATIPDERREKIKQEQQDVAQLTTAEDVVRYMRNNHDVLTNPMLCKKALSIIDDVGPKIIKRYLTTAQDSFIELAFRIFVHADKQYAEELFDKYDDIRNPYAKAVACLLFGEHDMQTAVPFLLKEHKRFQTEYSNDDFDQFPLLALHLLAGKK